MLPLSSAPRFAAVAAGVLALAGCQLQTAAPAAPPPPSPDYAQVSTIVAPQRGVCMSEQEAAALKARMLQQEMAVATLQCTHAGGGRAFEQRYTQLLNKFSGDLSTNARAVEALARRRNINFNSLVTDLANKSGTRANTDRSFCATADRALAWGLSPQATSLEQVPPPFDFSTELGLRTCALPGAPGAVPPPRPGAPAPQPTPARK